MSPITRFDDLCRSSTVLLENSDKEFLKFVTNQEECRKRWLHAELELERMISLINKEKSDKITLQTKLEYCRRMFSYEVEKRKRAEHDKDEIIKQKETLEMQLNLIKQILIDTNVIDEQTREKFAFLSTTITITGRPSESPTKIVKPIDESAGSILSPSDFDLTEDDLDSSDVKPIRTIRRSEIKRQSHETPAKKLKNVKI